MMFNRLAIMVFLMLAFNIAAAQNKIGSVDFEIIIKRMPETARAESILKQYQDSLQREYGKLEEDLNKKSYILDIRMCEGPPISDSSKQIKRNEMIALIVKLQNFSENAGELINKKAEELRLQVMKKLKELMRKIADENGYRYIFNICEDSKFPLPPNTDITGLVMAKLGL
jgi:outer membrane protein